MRKSRVFASVTTLFVVFIALFLMVRAQVYANPKEERSQKRYNSHPITPGTPTPTPFPSGYYRLPFDRNQLSLITNGPGEGRHVRTYLGDYVGSGEAIDFSPRGWTEVYAARAGTVRRRGLSDKFGNLVVVVGDDGFAQFYAHLASISNVFQNGDTVTQGQYLGTYGNTGCNTPPDSCAAHLHFEVRDGWNAMGGPYSGDSENHNIRRTRGIGWFPWYPSSQNSGFTISATSPHAVDQCSSDFSITMQWLAHNQITTHTTNEQYSFEITLNHKAFNPIETVNASHGTSQGTRSFTTSSTQKKYWVHLRAYNPDLSDWATGTEIAHQGPYKLGSGCPSVLPPGFKDDIPMIEDDD